MQLSKALVYLAFGILILMTLTFAFVPSTRPGFVRGWARRAAGMVPGQSPKETLERFRRALDSRDYEAAATLCDGDTRVYFEAGGDDARALGREVDNLRAAVKVHAVRSDLSDLLLSLLDPFPAGFVFQDVLPTSETEATAVLKWSDEETRFARKMPLLASVKVNNLIFHSLLPQDPKTFTLDIKLARGADGWKVVLPATVADGRNLHDAVDYLMRNGSKVRAGLEALKKEVKTDVSSREQQGFENSLRSKLEDATK